MSSTNSRRERWGLVDCNSFYCSCERLFRPWLKNRPVAVLSNNDGCIISISNEAKALGIPVGAPVHEWQSVISKHKVHIFSSNYPLYGEISRRVMQTLCDLHPDVIQYSIDEAFVNLTHVPEGMEFEIGREIRETILRYTGISVAVGIGNSKVLAKLGSKIAKKNPHGVGLLCDEAVIEKVLQQLPVVAVWGIGGRSAKKLSAMGIKTAHDLKHFSNVPYLRSVLTVTGERIREELQGINCVTPGELDDKRSIMSTRSFGKTVYDRKDLEEAVSTYVGFACEKLREQKNVAGVLGVMLRSGPSHDARHYYEQITMPAASADTMQFTSEAVRLVRRLYRFGTAYKKAGVFLSDITAANEAQLDLLSQNLDHKEGLMKVMDDINHRWGRGVIRTMATGTGQDWRMLCEHRSDKTQLAWDDLMEVR